MYFFNMKRDISLKTYPNSYVVLDIETTGFNPVSNDIIELSAIKVVENKIHSKFSKLVKPYGYLNNYITSLTGITRDMLKDAPTIDKTILEFNEFCKDSIVIGHNVTFDLKFINTKLKECHKIEFENDYIDTLKLAKKFLPQLPSKKLGMIAEHFNLDTTGMHRGLKDCMVTNTCYQKFLEMENPPAKNLSLF